MAARNSPLLICLLLVILPSSRPGGPRAEDNGTEPKSHQPSLTEKEIRHFDLVITEFMRERGIPGASVAISRDGHFLFRRGYGRAGPYRIVTPWSLFRIGSVSKPFTATGVLKLYEEGRLWLDSKVFGPRGVLRQYSPSVEGDRRLMHVTVRHLLQHTGGWDQRVAGDPLVWRGIGRAMGMPEPISQHALMTYMMTQPLQFTPGTRYAYSNFGYMVLGRIIESVTGRRYEDYIRDVLIHIGVSSMKLGHTRRTEKDISEVEYYSTWPTTRVQSVYPKDGLVPAPYGGFCLENMDATGGWTASASDLVRFMDSLCGNNFRVLIKPSTFAKMVAAPEQSERRSWYGLGVVVQDGGRTYWHSGMLDGSSAILTHDESGFTWAVLMNYRLSINDLDGLMKVAVRQVASWQVTPVLPPPPLADCVVSANGQNLAKIMTQEHKFHHTLKVITGRGYRLIWVDAFTSQGVVYFNTIWTKDDGIRWKCYHGLSSAALKRRIRSKQARGYRLLQVEGYVSSKRLRYAAIFVKDSWPAWVSYHGYSPHRHKRMFFQMVKEGFRLAVQSVTEFGGKLYVSAIYDKLNLGVSRVRMGLTNSQMSTESERQVRLGRMPYYIQAYKRKGQVRFSAIWTAQTTSQWAASHGVTKYILLSRLFEYAEANVPLACVSGYEDGGLISFAVLWR